jgi:hypothetical protein
LETRKILFDRPPEADQVDPDLTLDHCIERRAEISRLLSQIAEVIDSIKGQLASPRPDNSDPDWGSRAEAALKHYKRKHTDHERALVNLSRRVAMLEREVVSQRFVRVAKELLPVESYRQIWAAVGEGESAVGAE